MDTFAALADPTRRRILEMLARDGRLMAGQISEQFTMSAPAISQHLKALRDAKLVQVEKRAQQRIYRLNAQTLRDLSGWAHAMAKLSQSSIDPLDIMLDTKKRLS